MKLPWLENFWHSKHPVWGFIFLLSLLAAAAGGWHLFFSERLMPRLKLGNMAVGRLTKEEALVKVTARVKELEASGLRFEFKGYQLVTGSTQTDATNPDSAVDLFTIDPEESVEQAWVLGHEAVWQYSFFNRLKSLFVSTTVPLVVSLNHEVLTLELQKYFGKFATVPEDAKLSWNYKTQEMGVLPAKIGQRFPWEKVIKEVEQQLQIGELNSISLALERHDPQVFGQDLEPVRAQAMALVLGESVHAILGEKKWLISGTRLAGFLTSTKGELDLAQDTVKEYLDKLNKEVATPVQEARFEMVEGRLAEFQPGISGQGIDLEATLAKWRQLLFMEIRRDLPIIMQEVKPMVTASNIGQLGIKELIGVGKSQFAGSPSNRRYNIKIGASRLHGLLIPPDAEFSLLHALGPVDGAHGFLEELVIKGDKTIPEFGGGLCQIGTTTFRMALAGGLPILERANHSYRVSYYEPAGTDATIYSPKPDLRFKNDTSQYLLIQTKINGNEAIFELWGTNDGRTVEQTKPIVYSIVQPPPGKLVETTELPPGQKKCTEKAHNGASAKFTYTVTYPSSEVKEVVFKSYYKPWQEVCLIGVAPGAVVNQTPAPVSP